MIITQNEDGTFTLSEVTPQELGSLAATYETADYIKGVETAEDYDWPYLDLRDSGHMMHRLHTVMMDHKGQKALPLVQQLLK
ncbi:hypothetical protein ACTHQ2_23290, partial [Bacillus subtilis]|uniref:hypothetical protein n=1 Tax=Bacillus subtilis TaxID=1423 RepID=UPI003F7BEEED